ncbi:MAG: septum formation initiator family protein [Firmicutes bacterium]|nr:septum formation initiator family protein [Bacillota bacterium]MBR2594271.1 septum formation initiator family protein [Bacillota bacterium]
MAKKMKHPHNILMIVFMVIFAVVIVFSISSNLNKYKELKSEETLLKENIAAENEKTEKLYEEKEYYTSDDYIEVVARNQLGLIKPNEIVFIKN